MTIGSLFPTIDWQVWKASLPGPGHLSQAYHFCFSDTAAPKQLHAVDGIIRFSPSSQDGSCDDEGWGRKQLLDRGRDITANVLDSRLALTPGLCQLRGKALHCPQLPPPQIS